MTRAILEQFGLIGHFEHVQGTDGFPSKPEPDVIFAEAGAVGAGLLGGGFAGIGGGWIAH